LGIQLGWYSTAVDFSIELEREEDGRWLADIPALAGLMCDGAPTLVVRSLKKSSSGRVRLEPDLTRAA
jgi:hypothetical protein